MQTFYSQYQIDRRPKEREASRAVARFSSKEKRRGHQQDKRKEGSSITPSKITSTHKDPAATISRDIPQGTSIVG
jgi:hypothetical protein